MAQLAETGDFQAPIAPGTKGDITCRSIGCCPSCKGPLPATPLRKETDFIPAALVEGINEVTSVKAEN